jgi:Zn-dependent M28 family amino/carboxypeptidase
MSLPAFEKVFTMTDFNFNQLKDKADSKDFEPIPLGLHIDVSFDQSFRVYSSPNVIGILPGTEVSNECVLFMAHYDHLGIGAAINQDSIYNGAQDNASGTAALISLAEAYSSHPGKRSLVFIATTEEEGGLHGSKHYTNHPIIPLENTVFGLNMDMLSFFGKRSGLLLDPIRFTTAREKLKEIAEEHQMQLLPDKEGSSAFRSDHYSFYSEGIVVPSVYLHGDYLTMEKQEVEKAQQTIGQYYHLPNDEIYPEFNYDGVLQQLEVMYSIGRYYADSNDKPFLLPENPFNAVGRFNEIKKEKGIY